MAEPLINTTKTIGIRPNGRTPKYSCHRQRWRGSTMHGLCPGSTYHWPLYMACTCRPTCTCLLTSMAYIVIFTRKRHRPLDSQSMFQYINQTLMWRRCELTCDITPFLCINICHLYLSNWYFQPFLTRLYWRKPLFNIFADVQNGGHVIWPVATSCAQSRFQWRHFRYANSNCGLFFL